MTESTAPKRPGFVRYTLAACGHTFLLIRRRKQAFLLGLVAMAPVLLPTAALLVATYFSEVKPEVRDGYRIFVRLAENVYLKVMAPLVALFLGSMLIGEEVESQTISHVLTRPIPRSAWVVGKFLAYWLVTALLMVLPLLLAFAICLSLEDFSASPSNVRLLLEYCAIAAMAVFAYGALSMFFGALVKRPVILGLFVVFGWQRVALLLPGVVDFLTIEKHLVALFPKVNVIREAAPVDAVLMMFQRKEFLLDASKAVSTLIVMSVLLLALTALVVRLREYSKVRAVQG